MKKRISMIVSLLLACTISLAGCTTQTTTPAVSTPPSESTSEAPSQPASPAPSGEKTKITVWTVERHNQDFMTELVSRFNQQNEDIEIVYEVYSDNYPQTIEIAAGTNALPDILCLNNPVINVLLPRDMLYYLDDLMPADFKARFDGSLFVEGINLKDGKVFTLPNTGVSLRLVYNKDIFKRVGLPGPPETVQQMVDYSQKITTELSGEGIYGFALPLKNPTSGLSRGVRSIPQLSGFPVWEGFDFTQGKYDWSSYKPAVEALQTIFTSGAAFPGCESLDIDPLRTQFSNGKIGMYMTYSHSEWGVYKNQFPTEQDWGYALLPTYDGKITGSQWVETGFWYAISSTCKEPEKAWRVMEAFYNKDDQVKYYEQGLGVTVLKDVQETAKTPEAIEYLPYMAIQPTDKMWPLTPQALTIEGDDWGTVFGSVIFGARNDLDTAIQELNDRYNAAYDKAKTSGTHKQIQYPGFSAADPVGTSK